MRRGGFIGEFVHVTILGSIALQCSYVSYVLSFYSPALYSGRRKYSVYYISVHYILFLLEEGVHYILAERSISVNCEQSILKIRYASVSQDAREESLDMYIPRVKMETIEFQD